MNKQTVLIGLLIIVVLGGSYYLFTKYQPAAPAVESERTGEDSPTTAQPGKLKVANFEGTLSEVNTGCYSDGECFVVVDGKHITTLRGWSRDIVGTADLDALHNAIGKNVEVYAKDMGDGTYSLYGSEGFYVRLK